MRSRRIIMRTAACALCMLSLTGCRARELQFKNDHRLSFITPQSRQRVDVPVTIRWALRRDRNDQHGLFAVFVDRAPMPIGKDVKWFARNDKACLRDPRCPDTAYLADRNVFLTTNSALTLAVLPHVEDKRGDEQHFVDIVLLDGANRRIGESAWYRPFNARRRSL